jgi:hypothetical protein
MGDTPFFLIDSYTQECYPIFSLRLCHYLVISTVKIKPKKLPFFKAGKELKERVDG